MLRFNGISRRAFWTCAAVVCGLALATESARADKWIPIGARQRALGGAGVAATDDATSIYWNPANLAFLPLNRPPSSEDESDMDRAEREAARGAREPRAGTGTADEEEVLPVGGARDKWLGYDTYNIDIAFNFELSLTGDVVARLSRVDELLEDSDVEGAIDRASQVPPTLTQQDFRNLVRFYEELENLDQGGDAVAQIGGGLFFRRKNLGFGAYTNTYAGLRPRTNLASASGFSDIASADAIAQELINTQGAPTTPPTTNGGQLLAGDLVGLGLSQTSANALANLAEQSGVNLEDSALREALGIAATLSGTGDINAITSNDSGALVRGLTTQEFALALSYDIWEEKISIGVAPKLMNGITAERNYLVSTVVAGDESLDEAVDGFVGSRESTIQFGIDAGISFQILDCLRLGVVGRNLNTPRFKFQDRTFVDGKSEYRLDPQVRAGAAWRPLRSLELTCDVDLTKNKSQSLVGLESQQVGGGIEWAPDFGFFGFAIRGGAYGDIQDLRDDLRPILTGGIGFRIAIVTIDLGGSVALKREEFRDVEIPRDFGLAAQIGFSF